MASRRAEWAERVRRWRQSGLSARAFAESIGVKSGSLTHWAWRLGREQAGRRALRRRPVLHGAARARFVEVLTEGLDAPHFELVLGNGRRLHIPARFEAAALERLLAVLEARR